MSSLGRFEHSVLSSFEARRLYFFIYFPVPPKQLERASETCFSLYRELEAHTAIGGGECSFQFDP